MEFEQALKEIQDSIATIKTGKDDNAKAIADLMLKFAEIQAQVAKFNTERRLGLDDRHPFKSHELEEATKFREFFNAAMKKDFATLKTLNSEVDADGGILVPEEFRPRILRIIEIYGMARKLGTIIPMKSDKITMPTLASGVTVYWGSGSSKHPTLGGQAWSGLRVASSAALTVPRTYVITARVANTRKKWVVFMESIRTLVILIDAWTDRNP